MVRAYGPELAGRLATRLQELDAATSLSDVRALPQARAHELTGDRDEQISLDLKQPYRLILLVADEPVPRRLDGGLDWDAVKAVTVSEIVDTHG
jgi:proteic killer suppression protein